MEQKKKPAASDKYQGVKKETIVVIIKEKDGTETKIKI